MLYQHIISYFQNHLMLNILFKNITDLNMVY